MNGELTGSEDLTVDGRVEGRIDLPNHALTIVPNTHIQTHLVTLSRFLARLAGKSRDFWRHFDAEAWPSGRWRWS